MDERCRDVATTKVDSSARGDTSEGLNSLKLVTGRGLLPEVPRHHPLRNSRYWSSNPCLTAIRIRSRAFHVSYGAMAVATPEGRNVWHICEQSRCCRSDVSIS